MDFVIFLSGTTRGATLEGIGRSLAPGFAALGIRFVEISLLDRKLFLETVKSIDFRQVRLVFSWVSMGMDLSMQREDGSSFNPWHELGVPFLSFHGDSPAYFFDRHRVRGSSFISIYGFVEHCELRKRLPQVHGPLATMWPAVLDDVVREQLDFAVKRSGPLIFLKNGKDPALVRKLWAAALEPRILRMILELASEIEQHLDDPANEQLDDLILRYFADRGLDIDRLFKLRLFFIAQLDDYLRAVKATKMAEALMDFPVEIRGNNWQHLDFSGRRAKCIDECDYRQSIGLVRNALGIIDMSPNTGSRPHDRVMRAYGAYTLCLSNRQAFLHELPRGKEASFSFAQEDLQERVGWVLANRQPAIEMGVEMAEAYREAHPQQELIEKMLDWATMAMLDNLPQRPPGMQDYFAWPPRLL